MKEKERIKGLEIAMWNKEKLGLSLCTGISVCEIKSRLGGDSSVDGEHSTIYR